jgi:hypothetical protein
VNKCSKDLKEIDNVTEKAVEKLNTLWNNQKYDGYPVHSLHAEPSKFENLNFHHFLHQYTMKNNKHTDAKLNNEIKFLVDHLVKTKDFIYFSPCFLFNRKSCEHCSSLPSPSALLQEMKIKYGFLPYPVPSFHHSGLKVR